MTLAETFDVLPMKLARTQAASVVSPKPGVCVREWLIILVARSSSEVTKGAKNPTLCTTNDFPTCVNSSTGAAIVGAVCLLAVLGGLLCHDRLVRLSCE